jgi:hypothetical protein
VHTVNVAGALVLTGVILLAAALTAAFGWMHHHYVAKPPPPELDPGQRRAYPGPQTAAYRKAAPWYEPDDGLDYDLPDAPAGPAPRPAEEVAKP